MRNVTLRALISRQSLFTINATLMVVLSSCVTSQDTPDDLAPLLKRLGSTDRQVRDAAQREALALDYTKVGELQELYLRTPDIPERETLRPVITLLLNQKSDALYAAGNLPEALLTRAGAHWANDVTLFVKERLALQRARLHDLIPDEFGPVNRVHDSAIAMAEKVSPADPWSMAILVEMLDDKDIQPYRYIRVQRIVSVHGVKAMPFLLAALKSDKEGTRKAACCLIQAVGQPSEVATKALHEVANNSSEAEVVRARARAALGSVEKPPARNPHRRSPPD